MLEDGRLSCAPRTPNQKVFGYVLCTRRGRCGIKVPLARPGEISVRFLDPCIASMENFKDPGAFCRGMCCTKVVPRKMFKNLAPFQPASNGIHVVTTILLGSVCLCCVRSMISHARDAHGELRASMMPIHLEQQSVDCRMRGCLCTKSTTSNQDTQEKRHERFMLFGIVPTSTVKRYIFTVSLLGLGLRIYHIYI